MLIRCIPNITLPSRNWHLQTGEETGQVKTWSVSNYTYRNLIGKALEGENRIKLVFKNLLLIDVCINQRNPDI